MKLDDLLPITVTWTCPECGEAGNLLTHDCSRGHLTPAPTAA